MRHVGAIALREIRSTFSTPIAYALFTVYAVLGGVVFFLTLSDFLNEVNAAQVRGQLQLLQILNLNTDVIGPSIGFFCVLFALLLVPVLTMRSFAEERANGTIELLLTSPITPTELVLGKYLGVVTMIGVLVLLTGLYPGLLFVFGDPEPLQTLAGLMGLLLLGCGLAAIGCFCSAVTSSQMIAALLSFVAGLMLLLFSSFSDQLARRGGPDWLGSAVSYLGTGEHFGNMVAGSVRSEDLVYWALMIVLFLFLARAVVDSLRWR